jgi:hypothetical protein
MMGEVLSQTLTGTPLINQDIGSTRLSLDIEYQNYGWVWAKAKEERGTVYWEHHSGKKRSVFHLTKDFFGINTFGMNAP